MVNNSVLNKIRTALIWFYKSNIWIFIILFLFDIISKQVFLYIYGGWEEVLKVVANNSYFETIPFIPGFMSFQFLLNYGAAFGMGGNLDDIIRRILLIGISLVMTCLFVGYYIWKYKKLNRVYKGLIMALTAGAFGNLIDRCFYPDGAVIDFLKFDFMNFATFNVADSVLVVTIIIFVIYFIYDMVKHGDKNNLNSEKNASDNDDDINKNI